jgi:hypothetical protein
MAHCPHQSNQWLRPLLAKKIRSISPKFLLYFLTLHLTFPQPRALFLPGRTGSNRLSSPSVLAATGNFSRIALDKKMVMLYSEFKVHFVMPASYIFTWGLQ